MSYEAYGYDELSSLDDSTLTELYLKSGNTVKARQAVSVLISRYLSLVRKRACFFAVGRAEADDLAQEGLLSLFNAVKTFDASRGSKFSSYADVCVTNGIKSAAAKLNRAAGEETAECPEEAASDGSTPENIWVEKEKMYELYKEISALLSKKEWSVFRLYLEGLSYSEISRETDMPLKSVDNAVFRVKKKLKTLLFR